MKENKKVIVLAACLMIGIMVSVPISEAAVASTYYWWDNIYFLGGAQTFKYPRPDRDYYGINTQALWSKFGNKLLHVQMDQISSGALIGIGSGAIGTAIGAAIVAASVGIGTAAGAVIAIFVGGVLAAVGSYILLDESGCMWFWISTAFLNWISVWWALGPIAIAAAFALYGYLRVGSLTLGDAVGAGSPSPPSYYVSSINSYGHGGAGSVTNPNNLIGANDGQYTTLYGGNRGDSGWIVGKMNTAAAGHVYIYGYSSTGYYTHLIVSTSSDGISWATLSSQTVNPTSGPYYINCGSTTYPFTYLKLTGTDDTGMSARLNVDAVHVLS